MAILRSIYVGSCSLVMVTAMLAAEAAAEAVQTTFAVDANTTALYLFKEGTGTSTACAVTGVPAATFYGASWVPGRQYYAASTDSGYLVINDAAALRPATAMTAEAWVKLNQPSGGYLICKDGNYMMQLGSSITAWFHVAGAWQSFSGTLPIPIGQWTHVAMTYSSTSQVASIYVNGVLDTTKSMSGTLDQGTMGLYIGENEWTPTGGSEMDGKVDSLRISNNARVFTRLYPPGPEAATPKGNLVPNGDFEIGLTGWRGDAYGDINLCWETTTGYSPPSGQRCAHCLSGANPKNGIYSRPIPAHPGRHYTFSGRLKSTLSSGYSPRFEVLGCGGTAGFVSVTTQYPTAPSNAWQQSTFSFTLPSNFTSPSLCVHVGYPSTGNICVDDVRLIATDGMTGLALKDKITVGPQSFPIGNLYIYTPGTTTATTLIISNTDSVAHNVTVQPVITDWQENQVSGQASLGTFSVPANTAITTSYGMATNLRGTFRLGFTLTSEGQTWYQSAEAKYAVVVNMQNVGNPDTSIFAMNTHMDQEPTPHLDREMQVFAQCGVKWIRAWWGWGMCENPEGTYSYTEYDRQYKAVTGADTGNLTGIRVMPCMLRYFTSDSTAVGTFSEWSWAGAVPSGGLQQPPYTSMMNEWGIFCGKVAQRYNGGTGSVGNITAYELWNEPGYDDKGTCTTAVYTTLLNQTRPNIRAAGNNPNAQVIAFAGCPNLTSGYVNMQAVLASGTAGQMDAVSEHPYGQLMLPEKDYALHMSAMRTVMTAGGCSPTMPIWDTEQGIYADGDGYKAKSITETDVAQIYARDVLMAASQGAKRFFWFSADNTAVFGYSVTFGDYIPRPRLGALAACASFIEGTTFQKTYNPDSNTWAHMFQGPSTGVCAFWNLATPIQLTLAINPSLVQAFDTMGNQIPITGATTSTIQVAAQRATYLQCAAANYSALDTAMSKATVANVCTVNIATTPVVGGVQVTLTGASPTPVDGIVDLIPAASTAPKGWPAAQWFTGLALGQSQTFTFVVPAKAAVSQVRVRCGDRRMITTTVPYAAH